MKRLMLSMLCASALLGVMAAAAEAGPPRRPSNSYGWKPRAPQARYYVEYRVQSGQRWYVKGPYSYYDANQVAAKLERQGYQFRIVAK